MKMTGTIKLGDAIATVTAESEYSIDTVELTWTGDTERIASVYGEPLDSQIIAVDLPVILQEIARSTGGTYEIQTEGLWEEMDEVEL